MNETSPTYPTFTIAFEGLMLFHGGASGTKTNVAIVDAADRNHKAELEYGDAIDENEPAQTEPLYRGDVVSFSFPPESAETDDRFDRYVASLDAYTRLGGIADQVLSATGSHDGVFARVGLPGGDLTILDTFPTQVRLRKWIAVDRRCFPRYVLLERPSPNDVTVTIEGPNREKPKCFTVDKAGYVIVSNGCVTDGSHFHEYGRLLSLFGWLASVTILDDEKCYEPEARKTTPHANQIVICILRKRYRRIPNSDCGPLKP